jgi:hypothetical protein
MSENVQQDRAAAARAARVAKRAKMDAAKLSKTSNKPSASDNPAVSGDLPTSTHPQAPVPPTGNANTNNQPRTARQSTKSAPFSSTGSTRRNPPRSRSTSRSVAGTSTRSFSAQSTVSVNTESVLEARPRRQTAVAAQDFLQRVMMSADDDSDSAESPSDGLAAFEEEEEEEGSIGIRSDQDGSDIEVINANITVTRSGELTLVAPKNKPVPAPATGVSRGSKKKAQVEIEERDDEDDGEFLEFVRVARSLYLCGIIEPFEMTFEIDDMAKGIRQTLTVPSTTLWYDLQNQVARVINVFPDSMNLQYRFSNEKKTALPFNLDSHESYVAMCDKLEPLVVPEILKNGQRSTRKRKLVTIQLFDKAKNAEDNSGSSGKSGKVRTSFLISTTSY